MSDTKRTDRSCSKATDEEAEQGWTLQERVLRLGAYQALGCASTCMLGLSSLELVFASPKKLEFFLVMGVATTFQGLSFLGDLMREHWGWRRSSLASQHAFPLSETWTGSHAMQRQARFSDSLGGWFKFSQRASRKKQKKVELTTGLFALNSPSHVLIATCR